MHRLQDLPDNNVHTECQHKICSIYSRIGPGRPTDNNKNTQPPSKHAKERIGTSRKLLLFVFNTDGAKPPKIAVKGKRAK